MPHNLFEQNTCKYILTGIDAVSRYKFARPLRTKKSSEVAFVLQQSIKRVASLSNQRRSNVIMDQSLKTKWQSCLKNTTLRFEEQQQNVSTPIQLCGSL